MAQRTKEEIDAEVAKLREMKPKVRSRTAFGDSNWEAIDAQIEVLEGRRDETWIWDEFPDGIEDNRFDAAQDALRWREGQSDEPPSKGWDPLTKPFTPVALPDPKRYAPKPKAKKASAKKARRKAGK